jgi:hypothetical protein
VADKSLGGVALKIRVVDFVFLLLFVMVRQLQVFEFEGLGACKGKVCLQTRDHKQLGLAFDALLDVEQARLGLHVIGI